MAIPSTGPTSYTLNGSSIVQEILSQKFPEWEDKAVTSMWFMDSPVYVVTLSVLYLAFVTQIGPKLMKNREPFNLKYTIMVYNIFQVLVNTWFLISFLKKDGIFGHLMEETLHPVIPTRNPSLRLHGLSYTWVWWLIKVSDLLDTVMFVLRKKQSHVSFLHVYHHFNMVFFCWFYFRYIRGESLIFAGVINSFVHIPMYTYYFLAALGPKVQPFLWWKRYITRLQLIQFVVVFSLHAYLAIFCSIPTPQRLFIYFSIAQSLIFMALFLNFYVKAYTQPDLSKTSNNVKTKMQ